MKQANKFTALMTYFLTQKFRCTSSSVHLTTTNPPREGTASLPPPTYLTSIQPALTRPSRSPPQHFHASDHKIRHRSLTTCEPQKITAMLLHYQSPSTPKCSLTSFIKLSTLFLQGGTAPRRLFDLLLRKFTLLTRCL
jgi:hypothetical protein